jgi:hypothetical protein
MEDTVRSDLEKSYFLEKRKIDNHVADCDTGSPPDISGRTEDTEGKVLNRKVAFRANRDERAKRWIVGVAVHITTQ